MSIENWIPTLEQVAPGRTPAGRTALPETTIRLRHVAVHRGDERALEVDELTVEPGVTALVGPNGSGKSTLLHAIAGLLPTTGELTVGGSSPSAVRRRIAYVLQTQHTSEHLLVTAREVVALGRAADIGAFRRLSRHDCDIVDDALDRLDLGPLAGRHLAEMSGGQRQRVFIAQGLAQRAPILLLDEPVAGLDTTSADRIREVVAHERSEGHLVVVATHDLGYAATSDHAILLAGSVVAAGPPADVLTPAHLRTAYGARVLDLAGGMPVAVDDAAHHVGDPHPSDADGVTPARTSRRQLA